MMKKTKLYTLTMLLSLSTYASELSFFIKNDVEVESYLKIKESKSDIYIKLYCNNFYNDIKVSIHGLKDSDFYSKNYYSSKTIFGKDFLKSTWAVDYSEKGDFSLLLQKDGLQFANHLYNNNKVLLDMKELKGLKFFSTKSSKNLKNKMDIVFENCSIYF